MREVHHHVCGAYCNNTGGQESCVIMYVAHTATTQEDERGIIIMYVAHTATTQEDERGTSSCMWRILQQHRRTREVCYHVCGAYCNNTGGRDRYYHHVYGTYCNNTGGQERYHHHVCGTYCNNTGGRERYHHHVCGTYCNNTGGRERYHHHVCGTYCHNTGGQERYIIVYVAHTATTLEDERGTSSCMWRILQQHRRTREVHHHVCGTYCNNTGGPERYHHHVCGAYCNNTGGRERYIIMYVAHTATTQEDERGTSSCMWRILQQHRRTRELCHHVCGTYCNNTGGRERYHHHVCGAYCNNTGGRERYIIMYVAHTATTQEVEIGIIIMYMAHTATTQEDERGTSSCMWHILQQHRRTREVSSSCMWHILQQHRRMREVCHHVCGAYCNNTGGRERYVIMYVAHTATTQEDDNRYHHHVCGAYCNNTGGRERYIIMYVAHTATTQEDERGMSSCMWRILQQHRRTREVRHHVCGTYWNNTLPILTCEGFVA